MQDGLEPFMVMCTLGTTDQGAIDPVGEISKLAKQYGAWCHVDGAYGGFFLMCKDIKKSVGSKACFNDIFLC